MERCLYRRTPPASIDDVFGTGELVASKFLGERYRWSDATAVKRARTARRLFEGSTKPRQD